MSKHKFRNKAPSLPAAVLLRPRLDTLLANAQTDPQQTLADAWALSQPIAAPIFAATFLRSFVSASAIAHEALAPYLSTWIQSSGMQASLLALVNDMQRELPVLTAARNLLILSGVDTSTLAPIPTQQIFAGAFCYGNEIQTSWHGSWFADHRQRNVTILSFLTDNDLPWLGSVKDVFTQPARSLAAYRAKIEESFGDEDRLDAAFSDLREAQFKHALISALGHNRKQDISLPSGLAPLREQFAAMVLTLPDQPDTPPFTLQDFDALARSGQNVEALRRHERQFGKRVMLPDGTELRVLNDMQD